MGVSHDDQTTLSGAPATTNSPVTYGPGYVPPDKKRIEALAENDDLSKGGVKFDRGKVQMTIVPPKWLRKLAEALSQCRAGLKFHLLPHSILIAIADILTIGAEKYAEDNWRTGMPWGRAYNAMQRHLNAWESGETHDPDTGKNHLYHAACNLAFLIEWEQTHPELDNRPFNIENKQKEPTNA